MNIQSNQKVIIKDIIEQIHNYPKLNHDILFYNNVKYRLNKILIEYNKDLNDSIDNLLDNDTVKYQLKILKKLDGGLYE